MLRCSGFELASVPSTLMPVPLAPRPLIRGLRPVPMSTPGESRRTPLTFRRPRGSSVTFSVSNVLGLFGSRRAHQRSGSLHLDRLGDRPDLQRERLADGLARDQADAFTLVPLETLRFDAQGIGANTQKVEPERTARIRYACEPGAGIFLNKGHGSGWDGRPGRIRYSAVEIRGGDLCGGCCAEQGRRGAH